MRRSFLLFFALTAVIELSAQNLPVLKAQAKYGVDTNGQRIFVDSITHVHHNGRNSKIKAPSLSYSFPNNGVYNADTSVWWSSGGGYCRQFNAAGLITAYLITDFNGTIFEGKYYTYNSSMLQDTVTIINSATSSRHVSFYNSNNLVSEVLSYIKQPASAWALTNRITYNYYNGNLVEMVTESHSTPSTWKPMYIDSFAVNGTDSAYVRLLWNSTKYIEQLRHNYTRDASNRILTDSEILSGNLASVHFYTYDAQGRLISDSVGTSKTEYIYDAQSNLVRIKTPLISPPVFALIDSFTYNGYHQVTSHFVYDSTASGVHQYFDGEIFYYEYPVSVPEAATASNKLQLYPVPATTNINLSMSFTKPQPFSVCIFDMQGRLVSQWQEAAQKTYNKQMPLTNMAPGQYTLHIWAGDESVSRQFMVVR